MDRLLYAISAILLAVAVLLVAWAVLRRVYNRSLMATLAEWYMKVKRARFDEEAAKRELDELARTGETAYKLPVSVRCEVKEYKSCNLQVFKFNPEGEGGTLLWLYGGGYVHRPLKYHIKFFDKLVAKSDCRIIMPILPRAPFATFREGYAAIESFYFSLGNPSSLILGGDSSGGGLALGLTIKLKEKGKPLPEKLILFAPWVDIAMTNPEIPEYEKKDPRNSCWLASIWGRAWAGGEDLGNYLLSPINGPLTGLPPVVQYTGTRDLLYPDSKLLHEKLLKSGVNSKFVQGNNLNHVYPVYPIPEARVAMRQICEDIAGGNGSVLPQEGVAAEVTSLK